MAESERVEPSILDMSDEEAMEYQYDEPSPEDNLEPVADEQEQEQEESPQEEDEYEDDGESSEESTQDSYYADTQESEEVEASTEHTSSIDYETEYKKLTAPFKANGKALKVDNVDEAIRLMQMGANYNKKMTALKPSLQLLKMLERNDLLDEGKLSHLIDVSKKNPQAISKLLKDAEIDPMDLDRDSDEEYRPTSYRVSDNEMAMEEVLDELESSPHFSKTADIISKQWDTKSRAEVFNNPQLLKVIHSHVESGIYEQVAAVMDKERTLGNLNGVPDIVAYKQIGDALHSKGLLQAQSPASRSAKANIQNAKSAKEEERKRRKKAAMPTKGAKTSSSKGDNFNPLSMSDEEFEKMTNLNYM